MLLINYIFQHHFKVQPAYFSHTCKRSLTFIWDQKTVIKSCRITLIRWTFKSNPPHVKMWVVLFVWGFLLGIFLTTSISFVIAWVINKSRSELDTSQVGHQRVVQTMCMSISTSIVTWMCVFSGSSELIEGRTCSYLSLYSEIFH